MTEHKGYSNLIIYSILAGAVGIFVKLVQNLDAYSITFFRASIATVFIFLVIIFMKRIAELTLVYPLKTLFMGIFQGLSIFLYFSALLRTSVSNAIFLLYTAPIFSLFIAKFAFKEKIEKSTIIGICATLAGIIFVLDPRTFSLSSKETIGNIMGLLSGFFYSAMALTAKPIMKKVSGFYTAFWQYFIISVIFVFFLKIESISILLTNWWQLSIIGIVCTGVAFILFMEGVRKVQAQKIFIITALEPLTGTLLAILVLSEIPSLFTVVGGGLIIYGVYVVTRNNTILESKS